METREGREKRDWNACSGSRMSDRRYDRGKSE